ncbi:MAG TPA: hypothetical protein VHF06_10975 [Pseudonocardiaceae bacterium]|nr:hypothetical protein [Pseudonocardiaceae bacterium]
MTTDRVTLTGEDTGNYSSTWCTGQCDSDDTDGRFVVTLGPSGQDTQNGVVVTVDGFGDHRAVLTFDTAQK